MLEDNNGMSGRILDQLKLMEGFVRKTRGKEAALINTGSDKTANENRSGVF